MSFSKYSANFNDRAQEAMKARKAALEKFRETTAAPDPEVVARKEERAAARAAKEERRLAAEKERKARLKAEEEARAAEAERLRLEAEATAAKTAKEAEEQRQLEIKYAEMMAAEQKAKRDARYAARKARKFGG